jgi:hypothetical protein
MYKLASCVPKFFRIFLNKGKKWLVQPAYCLGLLLAGKLAKPH